MDRRKFIRNTSLASLSYGLPLFDYSNSKDLIIGHGTHQYKVDLEWGNLNKNTTPVKDCHEMVIDKKGRIILLTNHTQNNIIIYSQKGKLLHSWGNKYPGAHGLSLQNEGGKEFLYITDTERNAVFKTDLNGNEVMSIPFPKESEKYTEANQFKPTETAIASNGDIYIADGYGEQYILQYSAKGELLNIFGGKGETDANFGNAHGICIDNRNKNQLLITDRMENKLKRFTLEGDYLGSIDLPGAYICRPVLHGEHIYLATIWSGDQGAGAGFISILDKNNKLISAPGGIAPKYKNEMLETMHQSLLIFQHPHDVCIDKDENIYVAQWNSGNSYPIKLLRV